jgi:hypothetical protein
VLDGVDARAIIPEECPFGSTVSTAVAVTAAATAPSLTWQPAAIQRTDTAPSRIAFWLGHWPVGVLGPLSDALTPPNPSHPRWEEVSFGLKKIQHAYLIGNYVAASRRYGMFIHTPDGPDLVGVTVSAIPAQARVLTNVFPELRPSAHCESASTYSYRCRRLGPCEANRQATLRRPPIRRSPFGHSR